MTGKAVSGLVLILLFIGMLFMVEDVSAQGGVVRFRGTVETPESWGDFVCYGSYYCTVLAEEVLFDPNNTISPRYWHVEICYDEHLSLEVGEKVECYGCYYVLGACPMQYCGHCVCIGGDFYVRRFLPQAPVPAVGGIYILIDKLALLAPYIGLTILLAVAGATVVYVKKRKSNRD